MPDNQHWVGTWTTAPAPARNGAFNNQTLRMTMRASLGGDTLRVRISNAYGHVRWTSAARISRCAKRVPHRPGRSRPQQDPELARARSRAGPVQRSGALGAAPLADLAVSLYLPGEI